VGPLDWLSACVSGPRPTASRLPGGGCGQGDRRLLVLRGRPGRTRSVQRGTRWQRTGLRPRSAPRFSDELPRSGHAAGLGAYGCRPGSGRLRWRRHCRRSRSLASRRQRQRHRGLPPLPSHAFQLFIYSLLAIERPSWNTRPLHVDTATEIGWHVLSIVKNLGVHAYYSRTLELSPRFYDVYLVLLDRYPVMFALAAVTAVVSVMRRAALPRALLPFAIYSVGMCVLQVGNQNLKPLYFVSLLPSVAVLSVVWIVGAMSGAEVRVRLGRRIIAGVVAMLARVRRGAFRSLSSRCRPQVWRRGAPPALGRIIDRCSKSWEQMPRGSRCGADVSDRSVGGTRELWDDDCRTGKEVGPARLRCENAPRRGLGSARFASKLSIARPMPSGQCGWCSTLRVRSYPEWVTLVTSVSRRGNSGPCGSWRLRHHCALRREGLRASAQLAPSGAHRTAVAGDVGVSSARHGPAGNERS
jgi:hypothetical protein